MTNEEFQRIVIEKLENLEIGQKSLETRQRNLEDGQKSLEARQKNLEEGQKNLETRQKNLEEGQKSLETRQGSLEVGQKNLETRQKSLEEGQEEIISKLNCVINQTADLTEFREEVKEELKNIKSTISRIEINTADNWSDIAKLKAAR
ncbi:hypothetical protein Curi_c02590 [Gottschalkia acidurici 9a]|uniref:Uncharacterized protein n=1 Tax=Gottschalkia acidurici (strain ATCC 7906 / DSM 604 / BCRC 14475 / CIP 104303 / KCTC 5404 / NCIMB 10678 / 9a) TaxID=1128398 RepID=K0AVN2_GOTA9|nr:hypothetical protein [Gottschalkia acidurici]AFS77339.1 hypothetical protein Curi_c02590 [Gottschalkia acidurici 9a]